MDRLQEKSSSDRPVVWIVVLHYQGAENSIACLKSIQELDYHPFSTLIADNCSPDESGQIVAETFPAFGYLKLSENLGFAGGSNAAIRHCIEQGAEWIWLLNNDTVLSKDSLSKLMDVALKSDKAGVLGACISLPQGKDFHLAGAGQIDFWRGKTFERGKIDPSSESLPCPWISGCNMLFRASAFTEMNGFDERYFLYFEDTDICWRLNQAGWLCLLVPAASIQHEGNASTQGKLAIWRSYYHTRNRLFFFLKARADFSTFCAFLSISAHILRHSLVMPFRGKKGLRQLRAELLGYKDYLTGKMGKASNLDF